MPFYLCRPGSPPELISGTAIRRLYASEEAFGDALCRWDFQALNFQRFVDGTTGYVAMDHYVFSPDELAGNYDLPWPGTRRRYAVEADLVVHLRVAVHCDAKNHRHVQELVKAVLSHKQSVPLMFDLDCNIDELRGVMADVNTALSDGNMDLLSRCIDAINIHSVHEIYTETTHERDRYLPRQDRR